MTPRRLRCPRCTLEPRELSSSLVCQACDARFKTRDGVVDIRRDLSHDENSAAVFTGDQVAASWPQRLRTYVGGFDNLNEALYECASTGRAAWKLLLNLDADADVLEVGAGTGLVASSIAPHVSRVVALDFSLSPLVLAAERFRTFNAGDDITPLLTDRDGELPFQSETFDCVLLSHRSDWSPLGKRASDRKHHFANVRAQLMDIRRVLKDGGQVFWTADNRLGHDNWRPALHRLLRRGTRDSREDGVVPASLSYLGYRRVLRDTEYTRPRLFSELRTASFPSGIRPLGPVSPPWRSRSPRSLRAKLESHACTASRYGIIASKGERRQGDLLRHVLECIECHLGGTRLQVERFDVSRKDKIILAVENGERHLIVRIPLSPAASDSDESNLRMLRTLASEDRIHELVPQALFRGTARTLSVFAESRLPGRPLTERLEELGPTKVFDIAAPVLSRMNGLRPLPLFDLSGDRYHAEVGKRLSSLRRLGLSADIVARLTAYFRKRLYGASVPFGVLHGDFSPSNILLNDSDQACGLIDWEGGAVDSLPPLDAVHYVESVERRWTRDHLGEVIPRMANGVFSNDAAKDFLRERFEELQIDIGLREPLVYLKWLRQMDYLSRFWLAYDQRRINAMVFPVVRAILTRN